MEKEEDSNHYSESFGCCEHCGRGDADYVANPYYKEMNDTTLMEWICGECYTSLCGDI